MVNGNLSIRQVGQMFDVTARALRHYEAVGLLAPVRVGTRRLYSKRDIGRLKLILRGRRLGLPLEQIRRLLNLYDKEKPEAQIRTAYEVAAKQLAELIARRHELEKAAVDLREDMREISQVLRARNLRTASG